MVASKVGGLTSTVADGRNGYLIAWRCPEPFAEKLDLLLANAPLRAALGRAGVASVERFSWENVATALFGLFAEMLGGGQPEEEAPEDARAVAAGGGEA